MPINTERTTTLTPPYLLVNYSTDLQQFFEKQAQPFITLYLPSHFMIPSQNELIFPGASLPPSRRTQINFSGSHKLIPSTSKSVYLKSV